MPLVPQVQHEAYVTVPKVYFFCIFTAKQILNITTLTLQYDVIFLPVVKRHFTPTNKPNLKL